MTFQRKKPTVLNTLLILSREDYCQSISLSSNVPLEIFLNHKEADTEVMAHAMQFQEENSNHCIIIRSPSGILTY